MSLGNDPAYTDLRHDELLALRDRRDDHAPDDALPPRTRYYRERAQEDEARNNLRPRTGNVTPLPRTRPTNSSGARLHPDAA